MISVYGNFIEQRINGAQRTNVLAEWTIDQYGEKNGGN